jgi:epoxyqueuosine reductase
MTTNRIPAERRVEIAAYLAGEIKKFTLESPANRMPGSENEAIFDEPLVRFADGDDPIFGEYKTIIDAGHLTPREALARGYETKSGDEPERISVVCWILPISEKTRRSNREQTRVPSRLWSHTRWFGEQFNDSLRSHVLGILRGMGAMAVAPAQPPLLKMTSNEKGLFANWSERHIAYAAGLGTFGLSDGFITERGIAHRCGSVVASLELPASRRIAAHHYANCLHYSMDACGLCIQRCPVGAITEQGHDKSKCRQYLHEIGYDPKALTGGYELESSVAGCGLCQAGVSCEFENPVRKPDE